MAELDQALAEFRRRHLRRDGHELLDVEQEATQGPDVADAITHPCIIEQTFAGREGRPSTPRATRPAPDYHQSRTRAEQGKR